MEHQIEVRKMKKKDIPRVSELSRLMWFEHSDKHPEMYKREEFEKYNVEKYLENTLYSRKHIILVAVYNDLVVGTIHGIIEKWPYWYQFRHILYIDDVVVDKKHQHQGIATKLVNEIVELGKERGVTNYYAKVYNFNKHSSQLFQKCSFENKYSYFFLNK
jgi:GNAT superfamily N-acetyltransferase